MFLRAINQKWQVLLLFYIIFSKDETEENSTESENSTENESSSDG